jgi:hypothetical protein
MRIATTALVGAFLVAAVCLAIAPARHWTQDLATCRGGERVSTNATTVAAADGRTADDFAYICRKDVGPVGVSQSSATLGGIGVSLLLGGIAGSLVGLVLRRRR